MSNRIIFYWDITSYSYSTETVLKRLNLELFLNVFIFALILKDIFENRQTVD